MGHALSMEDKEELRTIFTVVKEYIKKNKKFERDFSEVLRQCNSNTDDVLNKLEEIGNNIGNK